MESTQRNKELITKFNEIQEEILRIGWNGVIQKYHPDINCDAANSAKVSKCTRASMKYEKRVIVNP